MPVIRAKKYRKWSKDSQQMSLVRRVVRFRTKVVKEWQEMYDRRLLPPVEPWIYFDQFDLESFTSSSWSHHIRLKRMGKGSYEVVLDFFWQNIEGRKPVYVIKTWGHGFGWSRRLSWALTQRKSLMLKMQREHAEDLRLKK